MASGQTRAPSDLKLEGYIVVETNYRVYAYTDSNLQVALLALFCEMLYRWVMIKYFVCFEVLVAPIIFLVDYFILHTTSITNSDFEVVHVN